VAVKPWKDANGTYRLAGYVAPDTVDLAAAEAHCRAKLLPAMVSLFVLGLNMMCSGSVSHVYMTIVPGGIVLQ
jgi:hypothetical protein